MSQQHTLGSAAELRRHLDTLKAERDEARDALLAAQTRVAELEQALDRATAAPSESIKRLQRDNKALRHLVRDLHAGWMTGGPDLSWHEWSEIRAASKGRVAELLGEVQQ